MSISKIVVIADDNIEFCQKCSTALSNKGYEAVICPKDGLLVIDTIHEQQPVAVIMDVFMKNIDAEGVVTKIFAEESGKKPVFFVSSSIDHPLLQERLMTKGVSYFFNKPFDCGILAERIDFFTGFNPIVKNTHPRASRSSEKSLETKVTEIILQLGVPAHIKGYKYIRDSIILAVNDPDVINGITKVMYPTVAKINSTTASRVERAIRHAIEVAWDRGNIDVLNAYFGYTVHSLRGKPTNSEFIAMIADKIRLQEKDRGVL